MSESEPTFFTNPKLCRWIDGDLREGTEKFCQDTIKDGSPYCANHHAICYVKPKRIRDGFMAE